MEKSLSPNDLNLSAHCLEDSLHLTISPSPAIDLDYWEVDPDWNGEIFRSPAQAVRPPGKSQLPLALAIPSAWQGSAGCLRLVTSSGERFQVMFDWQALLQA